MQEHSIPPTRGPQTPDEQSPLRNTVQLHPNELIDPWWTDQVFVRDYREVLYRQWPTDMEDLGPEAMDDRFGDDVRLVRRGTLLNTGRIQFVLEAEGALAVVQVTRRLVWVGVASTDLPRARHLLDVVYEGLPESDSYGEDEGKPYVRLSIWGGDPEARRMRTLEVHRWDDIAANYAPSTQDALAPLMDPDFRPGAAGRLIVWSGPPGTGKSFGLGALAYAWREWAHFSYVAEPEALLGSPCLLLEFMTLRSPEEDNWRVAIMEDTVSLFGASADGPTSQGLARLLNATDGMLGQGSRTLFVITTNERIRQFHSAVIRPGRCLSHAEFEPLPLKQAKTWLVEHGAADVAQRLATSATLAELYAMASGALEPQLPAASGGLYL